MNGLNVQPPRCLQHACEQAPGQGQLTAFAPDGSFDYVPDPDFSGTDTFTYSVSDGLLERTATVSLDVTPINDAPVLAAAIGPRTTDEDVPLLTRDGGFVREGFDPALDELRAQEKNIDPVPEKP